MPSGGLAKVYMNKAGGEGVTVEKVDPPGADTSLRYTAMFSTDASTVIFFSY